MSVAAFEDPNAEGKLLETISVDAPWAVLERFSTLVRETGTEDEWIAARYLADRLKEWGVPHTLYEPELFISLPRGATCNVLGSKARELRAKVPSFSVATGDQPLKAEVVYVPTGFAKGLLQLFDAENPDRPEVRGKVILTEGYPNPQKVLDFMQQGALGMICISPGEYIHEGIITSIWGAPDLDSTGRQPRLVVIAISKPDGEALIAECKAGTVAVELTTKLEQGWMKAPLLVAEIKGQIEPEKFTLLHGHIDSWHYGIGDNGTGDATLLELARTFHEIQPLLRRSLRIAWWPGHSTGRYAGSVWYADQFGLDLLENCVAHVNCDSPGCRWATAYEDVMWMAEAEELAKRSIKSAVGQESRGARPIRAGDISFNNLGISTFFMLSSTMPKELLEEKGYYPVGGCGANIQWHSEDDLLWVADKEILLKDIKVYGTAVLRTLNAPVIPLDYRKAASEVTANLVKYQEAAGGTFDLSPAIAAARSLEARVKDFYTRIEAGVAPAEIAAVNQTLIRLSRVLVSLVYSREGRFRQDPALPVPPIPDLAPVNGLARLPADSHQAKVNKTSLVRGQNKVVQALREAAALLG